MIPVPVYPFLVSWLRPCYDYAPLIWFGGLVCLWLTRYTHQLAQRWGGSYYLLSAHFGPDYQLYAHRIPRLFPN